MPPELLFVGVVLSGWTLGVTTGGSLFIKRGVRIGLLIAAIGGLVTLFIEFEKIVG